MLTLFCIYYAVGVMLSCIFDFSDYRPLHALLSYLLCGLIAPLLIIFILIAVFIDSAKKDERFIP